MSTSPTLPPWPWEAIPEALQRYLTDKLFSALDPKQSTYILVDPFLGVPEDMASAHPRHVIACEHAGLLPEQCPFLVELDGRHDALLAHSMESALQEHLKACANGSGRYAIGGWLQSACNDGERLAQKLAVLFRLDGLLSGGRYLRLADRRVLSLMANAHKLAVPGHAPASAHDWQSAIQGVTRWCWVDMQMDLQVTQGLDGSPDGRRLPLDATRGTLLTRAETINRTLLGWQQRCAARIPTDATQQILRMFLGGHSPAADDAATEHSTRLIERLCPTAGATGRPSALR